MSHPCATRAARPCATARPAHAAATGAGLCQHERDLPRKSTRKCRSELSDAGHIQAHGSSLQPVVGSKSEREHEGGDGRPPAQYSAPAKAPQAEIDIRARRHTERLTDLAFTPTYGATVPRGPMRSRVPRDRYPSMDFWVRPTPVRGSPSPSTWSGYTQSSTALRSMK